MKIVVLIISLVFAHTLLSSDSEWEGMILTKMLHSITKTKEIKVYTTDKTLQHELRHLSTIYVVKSCEKCDFILARDAANLSCKKPAIVFNYYLYLHADNAIGVFFWQKGRPTIRFSAKRLNYFGLQIQGELSKFVSTHD